MYSWEITDYINKRNGVLAKEEARKINNIYKNPQLGHIIYCPFDNAFDMWDDCGNHFHFKILLD